MTPFTVLSLGWGVQSFTMAAMSALGELPPVEAAIHADTTHESKLTYEFAARWTGWLVENRMRAETVRNAKNEINTTRQGGKIFIPSYTARLYMTEILEDGEAVCTPDGEIEYLPVHTGRYVEKMSHGQLHRQCTGRWKIEPMRRWLQAHREGRPVEQWIGISLDEFQRMKPSDVKYITNRWPLIERRMTRLDCIQWLDRHGLEVPPKSACTFCPYHSTAEWRRIKATPEDWREAVEVDRAIRKARPPYDLFVHPARIPLEDVDLRTEQERGQLSLWDNECTGICGV